MSNSIMLTSQFPIWCPDLELDQEDCAAFSFDTGCGAIFFGPQSATVKLSNRVLVIETVNYGTNSPLSHYSDLLDWMVSEIETVSSSH